MFWRFGFSSVSTLETLLDKPNVTLEDVLDDDDLLQECKSQNQKLVNYLRQPRIVKRLMEHVVGSAIVGGTYAAGKDWEEKVKFKYPYVASEVLSCSELWPIIDAIFSDTKEYLVPFWDSVLTAKPMPSQAPLPIHSHPLFAENPTPSTTSASPSPHHSVANLNDFGATNGEGRTSFDSENKADSRVRATNALENGPGRGVLAGYWAKVNGAYLERKPVEMIQFIKEQPRIVQRFVAHLETPAVVDLLFRIIQMEETVRSPAQNFDVINWLSSQDLISRTVELLAPKYSVDVHNTVSELLKAIIALSAPSPAVLNQGQGQDLGGAGGGDSFSQENLTGINNRLVRELASESIVRKMVGYMLDAQMPRNLHRRLTDVVDDRMAQLTLADEKQKPALRRTSVSPPEALTPKDSALADNDDDSFALPLNPRDFPASESQSPGRPDPLGSTATNRDGDHFPTVAAPTVTVTLETCSSTLVTCIGVFIELIRKNNSDYFEQHLLRTLHNHLVKRQSDLTEKRLQKRADHADATAETGAEEKDDVEALDEEEEDVQGMEEAMAEIVDKMGLVHLGPMLKVLSERLADFQQLVNQPRDQDTKIQTSVGELSPLTFERYRITELYAELLHCSNMALLNRAPGEGPQYSDDGVLTGGLDGLQILARTLQGNDAVEGADSSAAAAEVSLNANEHEAVETEVEDGATDSATPSQGPVLTSATEVASQQRSGTAALDESEDDALLKEVSLGGNENGLKETNAAQAQAVLGTSTASAEQNDIRPESTTYEITAAAASSMRPEQYAGTQVAGDLLKRKFLECKIMPSLLNLFFDYPWNNFLHNVVYDILQQCFNGRMDVGLNRDLTVAVFDQGHLTDRIVEGRNRNEASMAEPRRIRLGFMGHMNLIAEETVKLLERYPLEIAQPVESFTEREEWRQVVSDTLDEIREKEGGPLAFNRGGDGTSMSFGSGADDDEEAGIGGGAPGSSSFASYLSSQIGGGAAESDDEDDSDDEAPWLSNEMKRAGSAGVGNSGFDDTFVPSHGDQGGSGELGDDDDDDEWGPFADPSDPHSDNRQGAQGQAFDFTGASSASNTFANPFSENLTPADWSAQFRREYHDDDEQDQTQNATAGDDDDEDQDDEEAAPGEDTSSSDVASPTNVFAPGIISMPEDAVAKAHARRPSLTHLEAPDASLLSTSPTNQAAAGSGPRRLSGGDDTLSAVTDAEDPLGPGIPTEVEQTSEGLLQRTLADGTTVTVPLDEIALGAPPP